MKNIGKSIAWRFKMIYKSPRNLLSSIIRFRHQVKKGRIVCWAYYFKQYSCNPRALTEYLLENHPELEIIWAFRKGVDTSEVDPRIKCVTYRSWQYLMAVNTAEFLITNCRTLPYDIFWKKRKEQKYIMLWHGGMALKKIEKDVENKLGYQYPKKAKADSKVCDLMISGCGFHTMLAKEKFWYSGEVMEKGLPRSDIFFKTEKHAERRNSIFKEYGINTSDKVVLYAPTFRKPATIEPYRIDWKEVIPYLRSALGSDNVTVLLRLHPNLIGKFDTSSLLSCSEVKDATYYHDMQGLMCASDMLITDYSSSMFDMMLLKRPCMLYAVDMKRYDRGYYFNLRDLPFPLAQSQNELIENLKNFNLAEYLERCRDFDARNIRSIEDGNGSKAVAEWIKKHSL
jgi:CDP-glycerol glycerophosphotransferase